MGKNGLLIDEMHNKVKTAKECDPKGAFKIVQEEDRILTEISELLSNTGISGVHPIGYECQSSKINELSRNMNKLLAYPEKLIKEYYEEFDGDLANEIRQSCERLSNFYFDSIVYKNSVTDEIIERPLCQFSKVYAIVNSAIDNIKEASTGFLIVTARVNRNPAIKEKVETELKERYRNLGYKGNDDLALMFPYLEMEDFVLDYETNHLDEAEKVKSFFDYQELTERDNLYIRYYIYSADYKYRNLFLNNLSKIKIRDINYYKKANFTPEGYEAGLNISYKDDFFYSIFSPYNTLFHEIGHAADYHNDKIGGKKKHDIEEYEVNYINPGTGIEEKWTIRRAIEYDMFENPNNPHSVRTVGNKYMKEGIQGNIDNVIDGLKERNRSSIKKEDSKLYNKVVNNICEDLNLAKSQSPSDIYRGLTYNGLKGDWYHDLEYYDKVWDENDSDYNRPTRELWAEWFSYNMTGNEEAIAVTKEYFPMATIFLEEYVNENWQ